MILLDLDGTLTDPAEGITGCIQSALKSMGCPVPDAQCLRGWIGPPLLESFTAWFDATGTRADPELALALYRERFADTGWRENAVYPGIPEALAALRTDGARLLLATSKPRVFAQRIVNHFGLDAWLDRVYGSELDGRRADKVALLAHVIGHAGLNAKECMMIGDREHDMLAARHHGLRAVGVLWGYGSERELRAAGAECLLDEPQQLMGILERCKDDKPRSS